MRLPAVRVTAPRGGAAAALKLARCPDRRPQPTVPYDCAVPFTLRNLKEDLEDLGSRFDGAPDLEFRSATKALELEKSGLSYQRVPPDYRFPYGHTHEKQEGCTWSCAGAGG
jgi:hypothetical protein